MISVRFLRHAFQPGRRYGSQTDGDMGCRGSLDGQSNLGGVECKDMFVIGENELTLDTSQGGATSETSVQGNLKCVVQGRILHGESIDRHIVQYRASS